jgi:hypothetical protein
MIDRTILVVNYLDIFLEHIVFKSLQHVNLLIALSSGMTLNIPGSLGRAGIQQGSSDVDFVGGGRVGFVKFGNN